MKRRNPVLFGVFAPLGAARSQPGELTFEQATRFELVVNPKTARAPDLLLRAERVLE